MNTYKYSAISKDGAKVHGFLEAVDEDTAVSKIKLECPVVLSVEVLKEQRGVAQFLNADIGGEKVDIKALSVR